MITVSACDDCNQEKAMCDSYLRDGIVHDLQTQAHPVVPKLVRTKVSRAIQRRQSQYSNEDLSLRYLYPFTTPEGLYLGHLPAAPVNRERFNRGMEIIVRGLSYHHGKIVIPQDYAFTTDRVQPMHNNEA